MNSILFGLLSVLFVNINCDNEENPLDLGLDLDLQKSSMRNFCNKIIPTNITNLDITKLATVNETGNSLYPCDSNSVLKQIFNSYSGESPVICSGTVVSKQTSKTRNAIFRRSNRTSQLIMNNYSSVDAYTNGNDFYIECGTIVNEPCKGDTFWGTGTWQADSQEGCARNGISAIVAVYRQIEIIGKCQSSCSLGYSLYLYDENVNNNGIVQKK